MDCTGSVLTKMGPLAGVWLQTSTTGDAPVVTELVTRGAGVATTGLLTRGMATLPGRLMTEIELSRDRI